MNTEYEQYLKDHKINIWAEKKGDLKKITVDEFLRNNPYARVFNTFRNNESSRFYLRVVQSYFNELLRFKKYVLLNDIYEALDLPIVDEYKYIGWIYDENNPIGDNFVDFGIYSDINYDYVNGFNTKCVLNFNVDGNIKEFLPIS